MRDAERCVQLKPDFAKGYGRQSTALYVQPKICERSEASTRASESSTHASEYICGGGPSLRSHRSLASFSLLPPLTPPRRYLLGRYAEAETAARAGLAVDSESAALKEALSRASLETAESDAVQAQMFKLRQEKKQSARLKQMLGGMNLGGGAGGGFNVFGGGAGGLEGILGGMGGMGGGGFGGKPDMSEQQMRQMARAMADAQ